MRWPEDRRGRMMRPDSRGYPRIYLGKGHPFANSAGWQYMHRYAVMTDLGRRLRADEHVHHVDGDVANWKRENLRVVAAEYHGRLHASVVDLAGWRDEFGRFLEHPHWPPRSVARNKAIIGPAAERARE